MLPLRTRAGALSKRLKAVDGACVLACSAYGLGENVVQGSVNPDEWLVFKPLLNGATNPAEVVVPEEQGTVYTPIIRRHLGEKAIKMIYNKDPVRTSRDQEINRALFSNVIHTGEMKSTVFGCDLDSPCV